MPSTIRSKEKRAFAVWLGLCAALGCLMNAPAAPHLALVVDFIRHGDRTPTRELPGAPASLWPQGPGQLTEIGRRQEYELGARQRAWCDGEQLFQSPPSADSMRVFSTDFARTRLSARCFLQGFLGDTNKAETIPILPQVLRDFAGPVTETNSIPASPLMVPTARPDYKELLRTLVFPTAEWEQKNRAMAGQFAAWSRALEVPILNVHDTISPSDTIWIHQMHRLPYPGGLSEVDAQAVIDAGRWALCYEYSTELGAISGRDLLALVSAYRNLAVAGRAGDVKYILFSGHDSTLMSVLKALNQPLRGSDSSPYSASLRFAFYTDEHAGWQARITYEGGRAHAVTHHGEEVWRGTDFYQEARESR